MKSYLSAKQVVKLLNGAISLKLVYSLVAKGKLRANRNTGKLLIEEDSLSELMEGKVVAAVPVMPPPPVRKRGRPKKIEQPPLW